MGLSAMVSISNQADDQFLKANDNWELERLYADLADNSVKPLSPNAKKFLRGILCGYSPAEIAQICRYGGKNPSYTVRQILSKEIYPSLKVMLDLRKKIMHGDVPRLLKRYKLNSKNQLFNDLPPVEKLQYNNFDVLVQKVRSPSIKVQPPQEHTAREEKTAKNPDFVGREEAIAPSHIDSSQVGEVTFNANTSDEHLHRLVQMVCSSPAAWENLLTHITEPSWREFFLLTIQSVPSKHKLHLLEQMKRRVDRIANEPYLQEFLSWVSLKSRQISTSYKSAVIRAFYLQYVPSSSPPFVELASRLADGILTFNFEAPLSVDVLLLIALHCAFDVASICANVGELPPSILEVRQKRASILINSLSNACDNAREFDLTLQQSLQQLANQLPVENDEKILWEWWKINGTSWIVNFKKLIKKHRGLGRNWQFNAQQMTAMKHYCDANKLLIDCLNSVSEEDRLQIEDTLLLPIDEI